MQAEGQDRLGKLHQQHPGALTNEFACANLAKLRTEWRDVPYRELIAQTIAEQGGELEPAVVQYVLALDTAEGQACERIIDETNVAAQDRRFWDAPCAAVLQTVIDRFEELMRDHGGTIEDRLRYAVFQCVTLNFAKVARDDRNSRRFAGITRPSDVAAVVFAAVGAVAAPVALYVVGGGVILSASALCFAFFAFSLVAHRYWLVTYAPRRYAELKSQGHLASLPESFDQFMRFWIAPVTDFERPFMKLGVLQDPRVFYGRIVDKYLMPIPRIRLAGMYALCLGIVLAVVGIIGLLLQ